jgi:hypothetical protein
MTDEMRYYLIAASNGTVLEQYGVMESEKEVQALKGKVPAGAYAIEIQPDDLVLACDIARSAYRRLLFDFRYLPVWQAEEEENMPLTLDDDGWARRKELRLLWAQSRAWTDEARRDYARGHPGTFPQARLLVVELRRLRRRWHSMRNHYEALTMLKAQGAMNDYPESRSTNEPV